MAKANTVQNLTNEVTAIDTRGPTESDLLYHVSAEARTFADKLLPTENKVQKETRLTIENMIVGKAPKGTSEDAISARTDKAIARANIESSIYGTSVDNAAIRASVESKARVSDAKRDTKHALGVTGLRALNAFRAGRLSIK